MSWFSWNRNARPRPIRRNVCLRFERLEARELPATGFSTVNVFGTGLATQAALSGQLQLSSTSSVVTLDPCFFRQYFSANRRFLCQVYQDLLHRSPTWQELDARDAELTRGVGRGALALEIMNTAEYRRVVVDDLFHKYLHRALTAADITGDIDSYINAGSVTRETVAVDIVASNEYFMNRGGGTSDGYVNALIQDSLGRSATLMERQLFSGLPFNSDRSAFANAIFTGGLAGIFAPFGLHDQYLRAVVRGYYEQFLGREPDPCNPNDPNCGPNMWVAALQNVAPGQTVESNYDQVIAGFLGSQEYFNRATA